MKEGENVSQGPIYIHIDTDNGVVTAWGPEGRGWGEVGKKGEKWRQL